MSAGKLGAPPLPRYRLVMTLEVEVSAASEEDAVARARALRDALHPRLARTVRGPRLSGAVLVGRPLLGQHAERVTP